MARYIDAEIAVHKLVDMAQASAKLYPGLMTAVYNIRALPSADVRPERHGEWLISGDCYECSECGGGAVVNTNPFCWSCGAKMDE